MFYLAGPDMQALKLLELLMEHHVGIVCQTVSPQPQRQRAGAGRAAPGGL